MGRGAVQRRLRVSVGVGAAVAVIAVAAVLAAVFWPSGSGRSAGGPFTPSSKVSGFSVCQPIRGSVITFGIDQFRNRRPSPATIQKIGYLHKRGLKVLTAFVVPMGDKSQYGVQPGYPPKRIYAERRLTVPARRNTPDYVNLIVVTKLTGTIGHADAACSHWTESVAV